MNIKSALYQHKQPLIQQGTKKGKKQKNSSLYSFSPKVQSYFSTENPPSRQTFLWRLLWELR